jgi:tRNA threonylcarbamoyladenosine biosynthesis protein TsaE
MPQTPTTSLALFTRSDVETRRLGHRIGRCLQSAAIVRLKGELGSGKTCFVQGLARGLEVPRGYDITSPTYTLVHEYPGRIPLAHIDLYRIHDELDAETIGLHELFGREMVLAVEWADRLEAPFWPELPTLEIEMHIQTDDTRRIDLFGYGLKICDLIHKIGKSSNIS